MQLLYKGLFDVFLLRGPACPPNAAFCAPHTPERTGPDHGGCSSRKWPCSTGGFAFPVMAPGDGPVDRPVSVKHMVGRLQVFHGGTHDPCSVLVRLVRASRRSGGKV